MSKRNGQRGLAESAAATVGDDRIIVRRNPIELLRKALRLSKDVPAEALIVEAAERLTQL